MTSSNPTSSSVDELLALLQPSIRDQRVLAAIASVPRELFVMPELRARAWQNSPLPIGGGQTISQPLVVAYMCQALELTGVEQILDVGTGSGYHAAVLAQLGRAVVSIERDHRLSEWARHNLAAANIENVTLVIGDGHNGHADRAPYDAINLAAAAPGGLPPALLEQLALDGRIIAPIERRTQRLVLAKRTDTGIRTKDRGPVSFVPMGCGRVGPSREY